jgi:hypothetical protein
VAPGRATPRRPCNGVADIVQLEVEENLLAGAGQHAREVDAAGKAS